MDRRLEAAAIRRLEAEYSPATERFELDDWIAQQLFETYHNIHDSETSLFKFKEAVFVYIPTTELISATRLIDKNITEHSTLLSGFLYRNYGVKKLGNNADIEMSLMLSEYDFELMAMQLSEDLLTWYDNVSLIKEVLSKSLS